LLFISASERGVNNGSYFGRLLVCKDEMDWVHRDIVSGDYVQLLDKDIGYALDIADKQVPLPFSIEVRDIAKSR
jgi:hypothetical protein